jgi:glutamyl-tRNA synthetase
MTESGSPRVRFAPSPTGYLHVGGARTALLNWLYVRKHGGKFLLRIEDTDKARSTDESTRAIFEGLEWLGLGWDEPPVYQGANLERHRADAERMLANGTVYRCFCTQAELDVRRKEAEARKESFKYDRRCDRLSKEEIDAKLAAGVPHVLRFRVPEGTTEWDDLVHERIAFPNKDIEDFVILRSDRTPIYNMAVVSDDIAMRITLVMRGDDHISNTPKQIMLYRALGAELPRFAHLPMIHGLEEAEQAPRRDRGRRLPARRDSPRRDAQLPRPARLVAGRRPRSDDDGRDDRAVLDRRAAEEGGGVRHEEARVDERPAPEPHPGGGARAAGDTAARP